MEHIQNKLKGMGLTDSTVKTYSSILKCFFKHTNKATNITEEEITNYLDYLIVVKNYKARSRNLVMKVIKFYCREFLGFEPKLKKAKEDKPIPKICWDHNLREIMGVTPNIKHKLILQLMRYSGLRKSEATHIKKNHILPGGRIFVKSGKGQKDRYTICPTQVLEQLQSFLSLLPAENPYVFQGQFGSHYSSKTPEQILINAFVKLGWYKDRWFGCHALRHAFAIYTLENKIGDLDEVSKWLGHSVMRTSQIYTQCRMLNNLSAIKKYNAISCVIQ